MLGRGRPHRLTPEAPLWWVDLGRKKRVHLYSRRHLGVGEVVTRTVLRAAFEFMIYHKLLQMQPLRSGVAIPQLTGVVRDQVPHISGLLPYMGGFRSPI